MKCLSQILFSEKNKKKYFSMLSAENFTQSAKGWYRFQQLLDQEPCFL